MGEDVVLDAGAVIAFARGEFGIRRYIADALERGVDVATTAVVVAETIRGGPRDAPINRLLKLVEVDSVDEPMARRAGELLSTTESDATVDAIVVAAAERRAPSVVLTRDPDVERLAAQAFLVRIDAR